MNIFDVRSNTFTGIKGYSRLQQYFLGIEVIPLCNIF